MAKFHLMYKSGTCINSYTIEPMGLYAALRRAREFCEFYGYHAIDDTEPMKPYPNGKGYYDFTNLRLLNTRNGCTLRVSSKMLRLVDD